MLLLLSLLCVTALQNSALGAVLATLHFADPLTAVPCAIRWGRCCYFWVPSFWMFFSCCSQ